MAAKGRGFGAPKGIRQHERLDRLMARAGAEAGAAASMLARLERESQARLGIALRLLEDSSEEFRRAVAVLKAIDGVQHLADARRLARRYLDSIA